MPRLTRVLETAIYAADLAAAEAFYTGVLGLNVYGRAEGRHLFYKLDDQMLLIFNPDATLKPLQPGARYPVPPHGAGEKGHVCFRASAPEIEDWRRHLEAEGVVIEADFRWQSGGRSIYFRDPAGNSLEFAEANIWNL